MSRTETWRETAARIQVYAAEEGQCTCGEAKGHTGWLICALSPVAGQRVAPVKPKRVAALDCSCEARSNEYKGRDGWWHCMDCDGRTDKMVSQDSPYG